MPRKGVIIRLAWETIAEQILSRSLPLVAYLESPVGRLPELGDVRRLTDIVIILFFYKVFFKEKYKST